MQRGGGGCAEYLGLSKGGMTDRVPQAQQRGNRRKFSKIQKLPQTSPNFLKIVEKISFHQNNYFRSIKTCLKIFWSNAKRGHRVPWAQQRGDNRQGILGLAKIGTTGRFSKTLEGVIEGKFSYHCCIQDTRYKIHLFAIKLHIHIFIYTIRGKETS